VLGAGVIGSGNTSVRAGLANIPAGPNGNGPGGFSGWTVTWDPAEENGNVVNNVQWDGTHNYLIKDVTFKFNKPIILHFRENNPLPTNDSGLSGGLNVQMQEVIKNMTGTNWKGFLMTIVDLDPIDPSLVDNGGPKSEHPIFPHFHPVLTPSFPPFNVVGGASNFDSQRTIQLRGGPFMNGDTQTWSGFKLHDREVRAALEHRRRFDLIEVPTPEPSTFAIAAIGVLALLGFNLRRLRQRPSVAVVPRSGNARPEGKRTRDCHRLSGLFLRPLSVTLIAMAACQTIPTATRADMIVDIADVYKKGGVFDFLTEDKEPGRIKIIIEDAKWNTEQDYKMLEGDGKNSDLLFFRNLNNKATVILASDDENGNLPGGLPAPLPKVTTLNEGFSNLVLVVNKTVGIRARVFSDPIDGLPQATSDSVLLQGTPEPSTFLVAAAGTLGLLVYSRRGHLRRASETLRKRFSQIQVR
jgi:hypothetical protein